MAYDPALAAAISLVAVHQADLSLEDEPDAPVNGTTDDDIILFLEDEPDVERLLAVVRTLRDIVTTAQDLQVQVARTAHEQGVSWSRIGSTLGVSRQAAQQRFGPQPVTHAGTGNRVLRGLSRTREVAALNEAGREGWRLVALPPGEYLLEPSTQSWEVIRVSVLSLRRMPSRSEGWEAVAMRFPDCFYTRPLPETPETGGEGRQPPQPQQP